MKVDWFSEGEIFLAHDREKKKTGEVIFGEMWLWESHMTKDRWWPFWREVRAKRLKAVKEKNKYQSKQNKQLYHIVEDCLTDLYWYETP